LAQRAFHSALVEILCLFAVCVEFLPVTQFLILSPLSFKITVLQLPTFAFGVSSRLQGARSGSRNGGRRASSGIAALNSHKPDTSAQLLASHQEFSSVQDLQPPAAGEALAEPHAGCVSYPISMFRHVTLAESVYPSTSSSQL